MPPRSPKAPPPESFADLLHDLIRREHTTQADFAQTYGLTPSQLSHFLRGDSPSIETCLRIADTAQIPPVRVLRAARHQDAADYLEPFAAHAPRTNPLTPLERRMLRIVNRLPRRERRLLLAILSLLERLRP
jgi:transcriptional regulator with XRE-family HTH domain